MDLYLDEMQEIMNEAAQEGERPLLVSDEGKAVLLPQVQDFPIGKEESEGDLRSSSSETLAQIVTEAIGGEETEVLTGALSDGDYYMTASPIKTTGWVLVSAYSRETVGAPAAMLQAKTAQIQQEASEAYRAKVKGIQCNAAGPLLISALLITPACARMRPDRRSPVRPRSSFRSGKTISAALLGVDALTSAARSHRDTSISCPTPETTGLELSATARATLAGLMEASSVIACRNGV
jgi:hypothetical protein